MIESQFWSSIHVYVVDGFKRMFLLLNLESVITISTINNLTTLIFISLMEYGGLIVDQIGSMFILFFQMGLVCSWAYKLVLLFNLGIDLPFFKFQCTTWHIKLT
jgi:hypothetical protein